MSEQIDKSSRMEGESNQPDGESQALEPVTQPNDDPLADLIRLIQEEDPFKDNSEAAPAQDAAEAERITLRPVENEKPLTLDEIEAAIAAATEPSASPPAIQETTPETGTDMPLDEPGEFDQVAADYVPPVLEVSPPQNTISEMVAEGEQTHIDEFTVETQADEFQQDIGGVDPFDLDSALKEFRDSEMLNEQDFRNEQSASGISTPEISVENVMLPGAIEPTDTVEPAVPDFQPDLPLGGDVSASEQTGSLYEDPAFENHDQSEYQDQNEFAIESDSGLVAAPQRSRRGGVFAIGLLIGLILIGGAMYFAFQSPSNTADGDVPFLRASQQPVKEIPENPGGQQIPNQDRMVFNGEENTAPGSQERLVSREEPVGQIPKTEPKDDSRPVGVVANNQPVRQLPQAVTPPPVSGAGNSPVQATVPPPSATAAPQPRRVRTVIVRPDGTVLSNPTVAAPTTVTAPNVSPENPVPLPQSRPVQTANANGGGNQATPVQPVAQQVAAAPAPQPVAPPPVNAPVSITPPPAVPVQPTQAPASVAPTQVAPTQTAAIGPSPAPAPAPAIASASGEYVVQIAARRSEEQALGAFEQVKSQYGSVIGNYRPLIQRADLGDRGVYYRLRVGPMQSQAEASQVCENLKAAGMGDCLVRQR